MPRGKFRQGIFRPRNKGKFKGKKSPIFRSGWELKFFHWCDLNENVVAWDSECVIVPYLNPLTGRVQRYLTFIRPKTSTAQRHLSPGRLPCIIRLLILLLLRDLLQACRNLIHHHQIIEHCYIYL